LILQTEKNTGRKKEKDKNNTNHFIDGDPPEQNLVNDCSATSSLMIDPNIQQQQLLISAFLIMHVITNTHWRRSR
jgi:hypothetical protein